MADINPVIEDSWKEILKNEFLSPYFAELKTFLVDEKKKYVVYPPGTSIFSAFDHTPFDKVKVVIIGQDPYHGKGQANGLCFSVADSIKIPPSLVNIFKELNSDMGVALPVSGNLEKWAKQGILLLNATLTVRANQAGSHQNKGWEIFTDNVIRTLSEKKEGLIFILWGAFAQAKEKLIDLSKHYVLKAAHPSPFSAYNGFFGCKHFSKTNELLVQMGKEPIDWNIN
jgi:uracil-DNA glycosylase